MLKIKRRSFLKISFFTGLVLIFFKEVSFLSAEEKKANNKDLLTEANSWIVKMSQKEEVLYNSVKIKEISFKQKLKNKILSFFYKN
jgi:hypothetical protein